MTVRDGIVHPSGGVTDECTRPAAIVAAENARGVKTVHDHLFWVDPMSGLYVLSPEDGLGQGELRPARPIFMQVPQGCAASDAVELCRARITSSREMMPASRWSASSTGMLRRR